MMNSNPYKESALSEERLRKDLRTMKLLALSVLLGTSLIYIMCVLLSSPPAWISYLKAFAEASMIGALADWFAVTALFRHPMGIPIPHTAIIQKKKSQLGETLGNFIQTNFLTPEIAAEKLDRFDAAGKFASWISLDENINRVTRVFADYIPMILQSLDEDLMKKVIKENVTRIIENLDVNKAAAGALRALTEKGSHQEALTAILTPLEQLINENESDIFEHIKKQLPFPLDSIPGINDLIAGYVRDKILNKTRSLIEEIRKNENHKVRQQFHKAVLNVIEKLLSDAEWMRKGEDVKKTFLLSESVQTYIGDIWHIIKDKLIEGFTGENPVLLNHMQEGIKRLSKKLSENAELRAKINSTIKTFALELVKQKGNEIAVHIKSTVEGWDSQTVVDKIELHAGKDLQYIRINGSLVGGFVGLIIYAVTELLK